MYRNLRSAFFFAVVLGAAASQIENRDSDNLITAAPASPAVPTTVTVTTTKTRLPKPACTITSLPESFYLFDSQNGYFTVKDNQLSATGTENQSEASVFGTNSTTVPQLTWEDPSTNVTNYLYWGGANSEMKFFNTTVKPSAWTRIKAAFSYDSHCFLFLNIVGNPYYDTLVSCNGTLYIPDGRKPFPYCVEASALLVEGAE